MTCPARIRPFPNQPILNCIHGIDHDGNHTGLNRDAAYEGSVTMVNWLDSDRRNFTGDFIDCPQRGCILPAGHPREHFSE